MTKQQRDTVNFFSKYVIDDETLKAAKAAKAAEKEK